MKCHLLLRGSREWQAKVINLPHIAFSKWVHTVVYNRSITRDVCSMYESERKAPCKYCQGLFFFSTIDAISLDSSPGSSCTAADATSNTHLPANRFMSLLVLDLYLLPQLFLACLCPLYCRQQVVEGCRPLT